MALILCIETATEVCSVALFRGDDLLGARESSARNVHSAMLTSFIEEVVAGSGVLFKDLEAVAVSMGPGSYTGLRIGVATAKGLCYALEKPLIAVPTLQAMAAGMMFSLHQVPHNRDTDSGSPTLICPMIDARRMEVYTALFDMTGNEVREVRAEIVDERSFRDSLAGHRVIFGGEGAAKCAIMLDHPNALFVEDFKASAQFMAGIAAEKYEGKEFENLAYFEPFYLKDFVAGKPRVKGLK